MLSRRFIFKALFATPLVVFLPKIRRFYTGKRWEGELDDKGRFVPVGGREILFLDDPDAPSPTLYKYSENQRRIWEEELFKCKPMNLDRMRGKVTGKVSDFLDMCDMPSVDEKLADQCHINQKT